MQSRKPDRPVRRGRKQELRAILMPDDLSGAINRAVDAGLADSRSHLVRDAVRMWLDSRSMSASEPTTP